MKNLNFAKAEFLASYGLASQLPSSEAPEFVFVGRSNVGKSSIINKLCNRKKLARVSGTPGKTATINFYSAGDALLVDLPGYGYAKTSASERSRWDNLINGYFTQTRQIPMLLQLLDCRHAPSKDDLKMLEYLNHYKIPFIAVLTKIDKLKPSKHAKTLEEFSQILLEYCSKGIVLTSAENGAGMQELEELMQKSLQDGEM